MSRRNRPEAKRLRKQLKRLRDKPPAYIDLIEWLCMRHRMSRGKARGILMIGAVKVDSHVVGQRVIEDDDGFKTRIVDPFIPASCRGRIEIVKPDELEAPA